MVVVVVVVVWVAIMTIFCVTIPRNTKFETKQELIVSKAYLGRKCKAYLVVVHFVICAVVPVVILPAPRQRNVRT